ncbi:MAG TPA: DALR domain-containing protein, partial [Planctomycetota bacterium]|nr:DALR domain-containing protein [Planctomycetota bacterium]
SFDVHTGGEDNIFPHHECEIAQSEAATGKKFVRFWVHARHLMWNDQKISKSLGNVVLVRDLLEKGYAPAVIRYGLVQTRYSQRANFSWQLFDDAKLAVGRLLEFRSRLRQAAAKETGGKPLELDRLRREFEERMDDNLDVSGALGVVHTLAREGNAAVDQGLSGEGAHECLGLLEKFDAVFGVLGEAAVQGPPAEVSSLADARDQARKAKDFRKADEIRDRIRALGWSVEDTKEGRKFRRI